MTEHGEYADIVFNSLGVTNRLNPAQLFELELNFISDNILRKIKEEKTASGKLKWLFEYINEVNPDQAKAMKQYFNSLDTPGKINFIKELEEKGIYIHQPPFWNNVSFDHLSRIYDKYDWIKPYKCYVQGEEVQHKLVIGDEYILKLKHEPSGKFSARSSAYINMKGAPSKSMTYKRNQDLYSTTPIRLGEMEIDNLLLTQGNEIVKLASMYSSSEENRQAMIEQLLTDDVFDLGEIELENPHDNHNRRILDVYLKSLGIELVDGEDE